jgi:hypothetical protein
MFILDARFQLRCSPRKFEAIFGSVSWTFRFMLLNLISFGSDESVQVPVSGSRFEDGVRNHSGE